MTQNKKKKICVSKTFGSYKKHKLTRKGIRIYCIRCGWTKKTYQVPKIKARRMRQIRETEKRIEEEKNKPRSLHDKMKLIYQTSCELYKAYYIKTQVLMSGIKDQGGEELLRKELIVISHLIDKREVE